MTAPSTPALDRAAALERFTRIRARTETLFDLLDESVYYERPIALRNPVVFYEGHLPAFAVNTLIKKGLGRPGIDAHLEQIFERGIDPDSERSAQARGNPTWPSRDEVRRYAAEADRLIGDAIANDDLIRDDRPLLHGGEALWAILEHEEMHQETLAYMWHELPLSLKRKPWSYVTLPPSHGAPAGDAAAGDAAPRDDRAFVQAGIATLGTPDHDLFAWDNERPAHTVDVDPFWIDVHNVTNARFLEFVEAGGYRDERWWSPEDWSWIATERIAHPHFWTRENGTWMWRAMFEHVPLPPSWPVYVTSAEACAFARWSGKRLMTEAEYHRAAFGTPDGGREREFPWGDEMPRRAPANFDFRRWDPQPVGGAPQGASAFGVHDLVGNGWEWTSSVFAPFAGFAPLASYPEYSADFFDGEHRVMKGASPFTARGLVRRGFRNWFRTRYPYVYATFRCVSAI
jgi:gamma-glutamyl hercynylcysteine S-oxide synthase